LPVSARQLGIDSGGEIAVRNARQICGEIFDNFGHIDIAASAKAHARLEIISNGSLAMRAKRR
jgi:hypothetical protein